MARLPSELFLIQQIDGVVILFEDGSEREIVRTPLFTEEGEVDRNAIARAQRLIYESELSDEDKCFAHFWFGYFYAHAGGVGEEPAPPVRGMIERCPSCRVEAANGILVHAKGCSYPGGIVPGSNLN